MPKTLEQYLKQSKDINYNSWHKFSGLSNLEASSAWMRNFDEIKKKKGKTDQQITEIQRKKAVKIAKEISKKRDGYKCCYCGIGKPQRAVHSHHIFHEGLHRSMSADPDNLITLCATHHQGGLWMRSWDGFNFHNSPRESTEWLIEKYPELYRILKERSWKSQKCDIIFWQKKKLN